MLNKLRIKKRLTVSFILIAAIASIAGIVGSGAMFYIANKYDYVMKNYGFSQGDIGKAMVTFADVRSSTRAIVSYTDQELITHAIKEHDEKKELCGQYMIAVGDTLTSPEEEAAYKAAMEYIEKFWPLDEEIIELGNTLDVTLSAQAQNRISEELDPLYDGAYEKLEELMDTNVNIGNSEQRSLSLLRMVLLLAIIAVIVVSMVVSVVLGNKIAGGIAVPLNKLAERLKAFAGGNLTDEFPVSDSEDEVTDMVSVARDMAENMTLIIQDAKYRLGEMAKGDYTVESNMPERYVGEFVALHTAIHQMNVNMNETLRQIEAASEQVSAGSNNLAEGAQSLAEGATEQAGAVEELLATITNITEGVNKTAQKVEEVFKISSQYAGEADKSRDEMQFMVQVMNRINETAQKIGSIIAEIEEIASQTNLLSLNASIEAARAGEAGRGFAVVADQIGKLADESAQSAVNTRELITSAIKEIEDGNHAAGKTAETIDAVVSGINKIAEAAQEVSTLTQQQAEAMKQAEAGVNQISEVIQANSATAEESSATSEELSAQAISMDELVKEFKLR